MAETLQILSLSELINLAHPVNGAASLRSSSFPPHKRARHDKIVITDAQFKPDVFTPIALPVLLIGTVNLFKEASNELNVACINHCLSFSGDDCSICCHIGDFDPGMMGREIHVTAWNFLPHKHGNNTKGVLEIIQWRFSSSDSGLNHDFSLSIHISEKTDLEARSFAYGVIKSVSLIFSVPQATRDCQNRIGEIHDRVVFLAEILTCECEICKKKKNPNFDQNYDLHSFTSSKIVYFIEPYHIWRNIITKLIGKLIDLSGLEKKLVLVGEKESCIVLVSTIKTKVKLSESIRRNIQMKSIYFKGVITGIYLSGLIIELDEKVWVLIHDLLLIPQPSLRIGAIVLIKDFHFVCANFAWITVLIIGTCVKTSININSFTISDTKLRIRIQDKSCLMKFIESLKLSARFWVLITITCFRRKFAGVLSDKDLLGSKNVQNEGLVQIYATKYLPSNAYQSQKIFMRFCKHEECSYSSESILSELKLVVPICNFISKCEELWNSILEKPNEGFHENHYSCEGISYPGFIRRIILSDDIGCILIGNIKACNSSGRLKLVDSTGNIDIIVPDLIFDFDHNTIYEIREYKIVLEGLKTEIQNIKLEFGEPLSLRSVFKYSSNEKRINNLHIYIYCYMKDLISLNNNNNNLSTNINNLRAFHLIFISHKFPPINHNQFGPSLFAEALISPHNFNQDQIAPILSTDHTQNSIINDSKFTIISKFLSTFDAKNTLNSRILLEFSPEKFTKFQLLRIGGYYLINCSKDTCQCIKYGKMFINYENSLHAISLSSNNNLEECSNKLVILKPLRDLYENTSLVISVSSCVQLMRGQNANFHNLPNFQIGPKLASGDLVSLHGIIDKFHKNNSGFCIHLLDDNDMVKICGKLDNWTSPVGLGPDAKVTFHRLLLTRFSNQRPRLLLTPTTYIEIISISIREEENNQNEEEFVHNNSVDEYKIENLKLSLFSELKLPSSDNDISKFNCRVLIVKMLILEKCDTVPKFKIPLAGFILDDGSATCSCWAEEDQANSLLKLEISSSFFSSSHENLHNKNSNIGYYLERMLNKHKKVTIKNNGVSLEASSRNISFYSGSGEMFSILEERLIHYILLKATQGPIFSVVGSSMDENSLRKFDANIILERYSLRRCEKNIWAREVLHIDPLKEALNMLYNLTTR